MKKSHVQLYWWDWPSITLLFILIYTLASRLLITDWTKYLNFTQISATFGLVIGLALGYSQFQPRIARWISFGYMVMMLPIIWIRVIDEQVAVDERLLSVGGRLLFSFGEFFARRPVEDPLFFVAIMSVAFWVISASAAFNLTRHQNFLAIVLPSAIGMLVIQNYDNLFSSRLWFLAFFIFIALCLLGRLNFLQKQQQWRERRVFLSPENSLDLTSSMAIGAALIIFLAWTVPLSLSRIETLRQTWKQITQPWTDFTNRMENAVSALESPEITTPSEFYGTELALGSGFPLSDTIMFNVEVPDLASDQKPPRYYWRGRTYDYYSKNQWYITGTTRNSFSPTETELAVPNTENGTRARFVFTSGASRISLIYSPAQPTWMSRPGSFLASPAEATFDISSWNATPTLQPGETYQVDAVIINPTIEGLRAASTEYPQWVTDRYLQLPENFSPRIQTLAQEITAQAETPYDKTMAITQYLRENIEYSPTVSKPPARTDTLEWLLFDYKKGYCVYYASAEVVMLRSLGIPARMAVGFTQGTGATDDLEGGPVQSFEISSFTVRKKNAHAWPEVYFPGTGWVEFEPTGNQSPLERPLAPRDPNDIDLGSLNRNLPQEDQAGPPEEELLNQAIDPTAGQDSRIPPGLYMLLLTVALMALTVYLGRRYTFAVRVPVFLRATMERNGIDVPAWILRWERWSTLSPIERSFESINFGLRWVKQAAPVYATPVERAAKLSGILPHLAPQIKVLLDEHQTTLYTSRVGDEQKARRAANEIRTQVLLSLMRHVLTGEYEPQVIT
ncbi:MAG TPA: transglutaminaseTgpA domain-containing protein [Anaerolineales bacterium]|nr:transglutaminaseTgpA domain-containing protein [Anaerolineales bacterium]